jgi:hypothetical protein
MTHEPRFKKPGQERIMLHVVSRHRTKRISSPRIPNLKLYPHQPANLNSLLYQLLQNVDYYHNRYSSLLTSKNDVPTGTYGSRRPTCVCAGNTWIDKSLCLPGIQVWLYNGHGVWYVYPQLYPVHPSISIRHLLTSFL